ncbi:hypothetical protein F53441_5514 [Fusarium austroafricanum]|uniref:Arylamine N-acetyltransferase n=1 Tax=Fusarium austroafricanum TaxID=2364996 RepID=A0A8H4KJY9_9HYPO|nr:hypothetical protein F53441_5514 [Fusarium austroafricanum]
MADRIRYTKAQLKAYYDRISFPEADRVYNIRDLPSSSNACPERDYLDALTKHQLLAVPFENLTLHYSWHRTVDVNADHLFEKIVGERRGGYCMENNTFFNTVLLSLGYDVHMVPARVFNPDTKRYGGISHCLNVVTFASQYAVDVGFGARTPTGPLELASDKIVERSDGGQMRIVYETISQYSSSQPVRIYEYRSHEGGEWVPQWCCLECEVLPEDIRVMNMSPSQSPSSFFTFKVVCVQFTSEEENFSEGDVRDLKKVGGKVDGSFIIDGNICRYRKKGETKWERTFRDEDERLEALRRYFGVELTRQNQRAIQGTAGAIA